MADLVELFERAVDRFGGRIATIGDQWGAGTPDADWAGALDRTVHVSFGDIGGGEYVSQLVCDHVIHGWDLDRSIGTDEQMAADLLGLSGRNPLP